jgi:hypothetical protein
MDKPGQLMGVTAVQGWGLKQVLKINGVSSDPKAVRAEFADAAQAVLQQRGRNLPSNRVFEVGWLRRVATHRRPIGDVDSGPKGAPRKSLRVTAGRSISDEGDSCCFS